MTSFRDVISWRHDEADGATAAQGGWHAGEGHPGAKVDEQAAGGGGGQVLAVYADHADPGKLCEVR